MNTTYRAQRSPHFLAGTRGQRWPSSRLIRTHGTVPIFQHHFHRLPSERPVPPRRVHDALLLLALLSS